MPTYDLVVVHPLVLLSVVDHYNRVAKDTKKRVVGILLGETYKGRVDITNCFAGKDYTAVQSKEHFIDQAISRLSAGLQYPLRRMSVIQISGSWITAILKPCQPCSRKSMVSIGVF